MVKKALKTDQEWQRVKERAVTAHRVLCSAIESPCKIRNLVNKTPKLNIPKIQNEKSELLISLVQEALNTKKYLIKALNISQEIAEYHLSKNEFIQLILRGMLK